MRKPVHFAVSDIGGGACLYSAVCDDGSMWLCTSTTEWERLPDIPQDDPKPATSPDVMEALRTLTPEELDKADLHRCDMVLIELPIKGVPTIAWCNFVFKTPDRMFLTGVLEDGGNEQYVDLHMGEEGDTVLLDYIKRDDPRFPVREPRQEEPR